MKLNLHLTVLWMCFILSSTTTVLHAQNPISPPGIYLADPSAKVFAKDTLFVYGSTDESLDYYCSSSHDILYTTDMLQWRLKEDVFASKGNSDEVPYNDIVLFAPDAIKMGDNHYLYYCQPDINAPEGVAISKNALGPFKQGKKIDLFGHNQIDPSVFVDDDGTAYYLWGQFNLKMAKLNEDMISIDSTSIKNNVVTEKEHFFHEGAFMTKRQGIYYLVYSDISREDRPTSIGYATSDSPLGPYTYGGVIIDNNGSNPGNWNNHGSIAQFKNQWYVFYHRSTHGVRSMRKACVEKISFLEDGSIPEVEMTTQGASLPLKATQKIDAAAACLLHGNVRIEQNAEKNEILSKFESSDAAIYKYLNFESGVSSFTLRIKSPDGAKLSVYSDKPWHKKLVDVKIPSNPDWQIITTPSTNETGIHALWIESTSKDNSTVEIDWFHFN